MLALMAAAIAAPSAQATSIVEHPLGGKYKEAIAIAGFSGGLIVSTEPTEAVYDVVTTSPFSITQSEAGSPATGIAIGPGGAPWMLGSVKVTPPEKLEVVYPALYEGNLGTSPPAATLRYQYPTIWNQPYGPAGLALGSDGALWIIDPSDESIERYVPGGTPEPHTSAPPIHPASVVGGPEGALWFTDIYRGAIGRATTSGEVSEHLIEDGNTFGGFGFSGPYGIAVGPEALWFTEQNTGKIGRYTPSGQLTEYAIPNPENLVSGSVGAPAPRHIVYGPEGAFWFTDPGDDSIGRVTTSGQITEYKVPPYKAGEKTILPVPEEIAVAGSGEVWFTESGVPELGSVDLTGTEATTASAKTSSTTKSTCRARSASAGHRHAKRGKHKRSKHAKHGTKKGVATCASAKPAASRHKHRR
jgi:virginiamycin B lyase